ncbi:sulfite exporter TauE/SafE family protein [Enterovibrio norvegicus]|uniref:Probable membrane transporter protein n=1 Tax=Enterovibrio norvegicus TaxID=188144 RepID=A0ABV4L8B0_9GAMM|nr:sulfite exporter TauE/SafE family protein [Enterovibrio norvegicus]PMI30318.1 hypothetical protein BCU47_17815 [Enterovibrio norvegicus]
MILVLGALIIGLSLGLLGSGGAIITIPVLIHGLGIEEKSAIASGLIIVGAISLLSSIKNVRNKTVNWPLFLQFGLTGVLGAYWGATVGERSPAILQLLVLSLLMAIAGIRMLMSMPKAPPTTEHIPWTFSLIAIGAMIGFITGFVGVGGGFLVVPAILMFTHISLSGATATSLLIISVNALIGFVGYFTAKTAYPIDFQWPMIALMIVIGTVSSVLGARVGGRLPRTLIVRSFGFMLITLAILMIGDLIINELSLSHWRKI